MKCTFSNAWMRDRQGGCLQNQIIIEEDIQVDQAGTEAEGFLATQANLSFL